MPHEDFKRRGGGFAKRATSKGQEQAEQKFHIQELIRQEKEKQNLAGLGRELQASKGGGDRGFVAAPGKSVQIGGSVALDKLYGKSEPGGIHQILGTANPVGGVDTNLFTVLAKHTARVSVLWAANRRLIDVKVRIGFDLAGGGTNIVPDDAWIYHNVRIPAESTLVLDAATGLWLAAADDVVVRSDLSGVSFGASGALYATV